LTERAGNAGPIISAPIVLSLRGRILEPRTWRYSLFKVFRFANLWGLVGDIIIVAFIVDVRVAAAKTVHGDVPPYVWVLVAVYVIARFMHISYGLNTYDREWDEFEDDIRPHLARLHLELFGEYAGIRYTLFMPDDFNPEWLVARARYEYRQPHSRASASRSRYARNMGYTGLAWTLPTPDQSDGLFDEFPDFSAGKKGTEELRTYYREELQVPRRVARGVSAYMAQVKKLYGIRLPSGEEGLDDCGVLSVDVTREVAVTLEKNDTWPTAERFNEAIGDELPKYLRAHVRMKFRRRSTDVVERETQTGR
jgi:hypothetical protein